MNLSQPEKEFLARFIVESDAIERIVRPYDEVLAQLDEGHEKGHVGAYLYHITKSDLAEPLTEAMIRHVQALITLEQGAYGAHALPAKHVGKWRTVGVSVGGRDCPHSRTVPESMTQWVADVRGWQEKWSHILPKEENVSFMAWAHYEYLRIHPFVDGNGRSSRAIAYLLYRFARLQPFIFTAEDRERTYYQCFDDTGDMIEYFRQRTVLS